MLRVTGGLGVFWQMVWICYSERHITITLQSIRTNIPAALKRTPRYCVNKADAPKSFHAFNLQAKQTELQGPI